MFIALAIVLSIVESAIPLPIAIPGVKLGLANIVTVLVILLFGYKEAFAVVVLRCLLVALLSGVPMIFFFSLTGGLLSTLAMVFLFRYFGKTFSIIGISIVGALAHNVGQLIVAYIILQQPAIFTYYMPLLLVSGVITGIFIGVLSKFISDALQKNKFLKG